MVKLHTILHPTDFSESAEAAFDAAESLARDSDALLMILHVVEPRAIMPGPAAPPMTMAGAEVPESMQQAASAAREQLKQVTPHDESVRYEQRLLEGVPQDEIPKFAEEAGVDLIVIGTHGRTGLSRLLMGSVAESVVRNATCPVLTLRQAAEGVS